MKKYKGLVALIVVAALLVGAIVYLLSTEETKPQTEIVPDDEMIPVYQASDKITEITVTNQNGTFSFVNINESWYLLPDKDTPVLTNGITGLVAVLSRVEAVELIEENATDLSHYGLDEPNARVDYTLSTGEVRTIKLGDDIFAAKYYFTVDDINVYTMDMFDAGTILSGISAYRDMSLISIEEENVTDIEYFVNGIKYKVSLRDAQKLDPNAAESLFSYEIVSPVLANASPNDVKALVSSVTKLSAKGYVLDPGEADLSLDGQTYFKVSDNTGQTITFIVGKKLDEHSVYIKMSDRSGVYIVDAGLLEFLNTDAFTLTDKHISLHYMDEIKSITLKADDKTTNIECVNGEYFVNGQSLSFENMQAFYQDLIGLCFDARQENEYDSTLPVYEIILVKTDGTVDAARYYYYDALSYAVEKDGLSGFLIQSKFVDKVMNTF